MRSQRSVRVVAIVAIVFGVVTVMAGVRALAGASPGYVVYVPLMVFNTIMGFVYVASGLVAWRNPGLAVYGAAAICSLNLIVLASISYLYTPAGPIARESLQAMTFRVVVWLLLFLVLAWASRGRSSAPDAPAT